MVLSRSEYPDFFPQSYEIEYNPENKILIVDYTLPPLDSLPTLKEVRYNASRDEFTEKCLTERQLKDLYDSVLYQTTLRTIHELFEADQGGVLDAVVFNGWVTSIDPAIGKETTKCILSLQPKNGSWKLPWQSQVIQDSRHGYERANGSGSPNG